MAFDNLVVKANALNNRLIKMYEAGTAEPDDVSDVMKVAYLVGPEQAGDTVYLFAPERRGWHKRARDTNEIIVDRPQIYEAVLANDDRYLVIDVALNDFKDDKIEKYDVVARDLGTAAVTGPAIDLEELMIVADDAAALCYDGKPLFATDHPVNPSKSSSGTWANKFVKPAGLTYDTFGQVFQSFLKFPSQTPGKVAGSQPSHLLVGPNDWIMANDICFNEKPSGLQGANNPWTKFGIQPMLVANWTRDAWMMLDARKPTKRAFVFQEREAAQMVPSGIDPNGALEWERNTLRWIVKGRSAPGYGYPQRGALVVKS